MFSILFVSFILGLFCLLYIHKFDLWEPEPIGTMILVTILGGILSITISLGLCHWIGIYVCKVEHSVNHAFLIIGPVEEFSKMITYIILFFWIFRKNVNESVDAIIYLSCISLGFSFLENISYSLQGDMRTLFLRYILATPAHILFAMPMAYALYKFYQQNGSKKDLLYGFVFSSILHGIWDAFAFSSFPLLFILLLLFGMWKHFKSHVKQGLLCSNYYPNITQFFLNGEILSQRKAICIKCNSEHTLAPFYNKNILYSICPDCGSIIVDRDNAFEVYRYFLVEFDNLSSLYVPSEENNRWHTINHCVFFDEKLKFGFVHLDNLLEKTKEEICYFTND